MCGDLINLTILIDRIDDSTVVESNQNLISSLFDMNIVAYNNFTRTIPSEIGLMTGLNHLSSGKWE